MNKVVLIGRLTKDIDLRISGETKIGIFTLAVNRPGKNKGADFIQCKAFDGRAETLKQYVEKGHQLAIEGSIRTGRYQNNDGTTVYTTEVLVLGFDFLENKKRTQTEEQYNDDKFSNGEYDWGGDEAPWP